MASYNGNLLRCLQTMKGDTLGRRGAFEIDPTTHTTLKNAVVAWNSKMIYQHHTATVASS